MKPVWKEEIVIRSYDVDCKNQLRIDRICSYFQEVAEHHADDLGVGFDQMQVAGLVWVLSRLEIRFDSFPEWGDAITIETWPSGNERLYYRREFSVIRQDGIKIITASSFWLSINIQNRRPKLFPLPEVVKELEGSYALEVMTGAIPHPVEEESRIITVQYGDLDLNRHVNNARYVYWITDMFPVEYQDEHAIESFRIDIRQEIKANESVKINKGSSDGTFALEGINIHSQTVCFQARVKYRPL